MESKDEDSVQRRAFVQILFGSNMGWNLNTTIGERSARLQSRFKKELVKAYDAKYPQGGHFFWCPVLADWVERIVAGHLFPAKAGYEVMASIFGQPVLNIDPKRPQEGKGELFRAVNGILWSYAAEKRFEKGQFVVVPDISDMASEAEIQAWRASKPREFKIRVVKPGAEEMQMIVKPGSSKQWKDLDNTKLRFRSDFRPRTRYLYFAYCQVILRNAWPNSSLLQGEVGKKYWGSTGRFMRKNMLAGFVEQLGQDWEYLLDNAFEDEEGDQVEPDDTAVCVANKDNEQKMMTEEERLDAEEQEEEEEEEEEAAAAAAAAAAAEKAAEEEEVVVEGGGGGGSLGEDTAAFCPRCFIESGTYRHVVVDAGRLTYLEYLKINSVGFLPMTTSGLAVLLSLRP